MNIRAARRVFVEDGTRPALKQGEFLLPEEVYWASPAQSEKQWLH